MKSNLAPFKTLSVHRFDIAQTSSKMDISRVVTLGMGFNEFSLFISHFNRLPNFISQKNIDCFKANKWFVDYYRQEIKDYYFKSYCLSNSEKPQLDDVFYFLYEDLLVDFDTDNSFVRFLFKTTAIDKVEDVIQKITRFKKAKGKPMVSLLVNARNSIETKSLMVTKPRFSIKDNYNDDFIEVHQTILRRLSKKNDKGLILLHGKPGTGKTTYIRYLISTIKKNVIFLPPNMAKSITSPHLISILLENPNSVFVIEDAEQIIADRELDDNSPVSALLNISDGLLSDCLNIQIICSFNIDLSKIDNALLRKGRLIARYEFRELEIAKAQALSDKLGYSSAICVPSTLTAIYNQEEKDLLISARSNGIGFKYSGE